MKYLKLFEYFSDLNTKIDLYLKDDVLIKDMPFDYQAALMIRLYEVNEDIQWSIDIDYRTIDLVKDVDTMKILINDMIEDPSYGRRKYSYGQVPVELMKAKVEERMIELEEWESFDEWLQCYQPHPEHGVYTSNKAIPLLVSEDDEYSAYIEDGWNRFRHYITLNIKMIPIVKY
jgi:hypothetical protein